MNEFKKLCFSRSRFVIATQFKAVLEGKYEEMTMRKDDAVCLRARMQAGISYAVWSHGTDGHVFQHGVALALPSSIVGFITVVKGDLRS